jgi:Tol biopolymer transport system component
MPPSCRWLRCSGICAAATTAWVLLLAGLPRVDIVAQEKIERKDQGRIILWMDSSDQFVDRRVAAVTLHDKTIHRLTEPLPHASQPAWSVVVSGDGKTIAYLADETAPPEGGQVTWTLFVRSPDELKGKGQSLGVNKVTQIVAWSPDGKQLIVTTQEDSDAKSRQVLVEAKTKAVKKLPLPKAEPPEGSQYFSDHYVTDWSPDGEWFLSSCTYRDKSEKWRRDMYLVKSDGSAAKRLKHIPSGAGGKFSPDGKRILFVAKHEADGKTVDQLYVADVVGGEPVRVSHELNGMLGVWGFSWSPDGKRIAYVWDNRAEGDAHETFLMLVDADGKNSQVLCSQKCSRTCFISPNWR